MSSPLLADVLRERAARNRAALGGYESGGADVNRSGAPIYEAMSSQPFAQAIARGQLPQEPSLQTLPYALSVLGEAMSDLQGNRPGWQLSTIPRPNRISERFRQVFPKAHAAMERDPITRYEFQQGGLMTRGSVAETQTWKNFPSPQDENWDVRFAFHPDYYKYLEPGGPTRLLEEVAAKKVPLKDARIFLHALGHETGGHGLAAGKGRAAATRYGDERLFRTGDTTASYHLRPGSKAAETADDFFRDQLRTTPIGGRPGDPGRRSNPYIYDYGESHPARTQPGGRVNEMMAEHVGQSMSLRAADDEFRSVAQILRDAPEGYDLTGFARRQRAIMDLRRKESVAERKKFIEDYLRTPAK